MAVAFSMTSEHVSNYVLRTSANSVEGNLMFVVFYYYLNVKPVIFDRALTILTLAVTLSFSIRSSSIVGFIPLALVLIIKDFRYFLPILVAGLTVAIPIVLINLWSDSYFYGYFTVPQYNFVYVNVVMGISKYFGEMPWHYYIYFLYSEFCEIETYGIPVFFLLSVRQMQGTLGPTSGNGWMRKIRGETPPEKLIRVPFLLLFFYVNFGILSALAHKEMRFITSIIQIGQIAMSYMICWSFDVREVLLKWVEQKGVSKKSKAYRGLWYISGLCCKYFACFVFFKQERARIRRWLKTADIKNDSSLESYNLFSGRSPIIGDE